MRSPVQEPADSSSKNDNELTYRSSSPVRLGCTVGLKDSFLTDSYVTFLLYTYIRLHMYTVQHIH